MQAFIALQRSPVSLASLSTNEFWGLKTSVISISSAAGAPAGGKEHLLLPSQTFFAYLHPSPLPMLRFEEGVRILAAYLAPHLPQATKQALHPCSSRSLKVPVEVHILVADAVPEISRCSDRTYSIYKCIDSLRPSCCSP
jgi:hypothetical protein